MSLNKILSKIFGEQIFNEKAASDSENNGSKGYDPPLQDQVSLVKVWLRKKMVLAEDKCKDALLLEEELMKFRLGPNRVTFDIDFNSTIRISVDRLTVRSQGSFNTIKANSCVFGGKWMYEVQLHSKGVMQIGWCSNQCTFNENGGVGDTVNSYGFDGSKKQKWHMSTTKYGEQWQTGDIIGVCLNLDNTSIEFYRNGVHLGKAYDDIAKGPGLAFFPAVSMGFSEGLRANFGNFPFRFPVPGYYPLQSKPHQKLEKADILLRYLVNLAGILSRPKYRPKEGRFSSKKTMYTLFSSLLISRLVEHLVDAYVIEEVLLPYIMSLCVVRTESSESEYVILPGSADSSLGTLLSMFWNYLEPDEIKYILKKLLNALLSKYSQTAKDLENDTQRKMIVVLNCICTHPPTRRFYLENKFFKKHCFSLLMYLKPPEYGAMTATLPNNVLWTEGIGGSKEHYLAAAEALAIAIEPIYELQKDLLRHLLTNTDGDTDVPSSRKIFTNKLRKYVMDASIEQRPLQSMFLMQSSIHHPIEAPVALSVLCVLIDVIKQELEELCLNQEIAIPPKSFFDGTFQYQHFDRIGGVLSHLYKVHRNELNQELGSERVAVLSMQERNTFRSGEMGASVLFTPTNLNNVPLVGRSQGTTTSPSHIQFFRQTIEEPSPGNAPALESLYELLDVATIYYYAVGHKHVVKISSVRDELASLNYILQGTKKTREDLSRQLKEMSGVSCNVNDTLSDLCDQFRQREEVFMNRSMELSRKQAWYRTVALGPQRRKLLLWLLMCTLNTLKKSSEMGSLFAFTPEVYINILPVLLDSTLDFSFHDLTPQFEINDALREIAAAASFLGEHSADPRIILASCKDSLLQALGTLICHESGIQALEGAPKKSQDALIKALLRPYENRAWGQSNWLLLRCWLGEGFAFKDARQPTIWQGGDDAVTRGLCRSRARSETHTGLLHHVAPAYPSKYFQDLIGSYLIEMESHATAFLNSVLGQLNWAFSEFILLLQEIQNTANRQETTIFDSKQLKICSMCFELTVSLMRCLEMVISIAPNIVQDSGRPNSDLILNRICQLVSQVLSRVTVPPGCFQFIVDMCSTDLIAVTHFSIISAALGILLALMKTEIENDETPSKITRLTRSLLTDPSFQIAHLEFALGEIKTPILQQAETPRGNFNPQTRAHIDPLTNDVRVPYPSTSKKRIRSDAPIIKFSLYDYPDLVTEEEIERVKKLIEVLRTKQSLLSDITLPSEDSLCPICCAKPIAATFNPCKHQSCSNCILQHLMNSKLCFYCKTLIVDIESSDGKIIYGPVTGE